MLAGRGITPVGASGGNEAVRIFGTASPAVSARSICCASRRESPSGSGTASSASASNDVCSYRSATSLFNAR